MKAFSRFRLHSYIHTRTNCIQVQLNFVYLYHRAYGMSACVLSLQILFFIGVYFFGEKMQWDAKRQIETRKKKFHWLRFKVKTVSKGCKSKAKQRKYIGHIEKKGRRRIAIFKSYYIFCKTKDKTNKSKNIQKTKRLQYFFNMAWNNKGFKVC